MTCSLQSSIDDLLNVLPGKFTQPLPAPLREALLTAELPISPEEDYTRGLADRNRTRMRLRHLVVGHGWSVTDLKAQAQVSELS